MINRKQNIPQGWRIDLLENLADRGSGHTPDKNESGYWNGGIKWVSLADSWRLDNLFISETDKEISILGLQNSSAVLHPPNTVILSRDAGVGKSAILKSEMAVSQHFIAWRCQPKNKLFNLFFYYWLQLRKEEFERVAVGSTIKTIGLPYFKKLKIVYPPLAEQKKIAEIINCWDSAIAITEKLITAKRRLKQELIRKSLENSFWSASLLNSKFDEEEWKIKSLSSYFTERIETSSDIDKYPLFSLTIENGIVEKTDRYNREFLLKNRAENQYRVVHTGDFVFNPMNLRFGAIAISNIPHPVVVSAYYNVLIPNHKLIDNNFMIEILKSKRMIQVYNNIGKGSLVEKKRVHLKDFMKIKVPIPSLEQQKRIAYTISFLSEEETLLTRKLKLFQTQKQGLMQQLLTGKIRIQTP